MSDFRKCLDEESIDFMKEQKMFFVSTAPKSGKINLSPKGFDSIKIIDNNTIIWLNHFGSGNETAAHLIEDDRITLMFCAFEGKALILRIYAHAKVLHERDEDYSKYIKEFPYNNAARQIFVLDIDCINLSCGMGVPLYDYKEQRKELKEFYDSRTKEEHRAYMKKNNVLSFDKKETNLFKEV